MNALLELFGMARSNPRLAMNDPTRLQGRHCAARLIRAKAKRRRGRVVNGKRKRAGRATYTP